MEKTSIVVFHNSGNDGKQREFRRLGWKPRFHAVHTDEPHETFSANALHKAKAVAALLASDHPNALFAGEDSGICVPELGDFPGPFSRRIQMFELLKDNTVKPRDAAAVVDGRLDEINCSYLQQIIRARGLFEKYPDGVPAYYAVAFALCDAEGGVVKTLEARSEVFVVENYIQRMGFGYDWICRHAEIGHLGNAEPTDKDRVLHRGKLVSELLAWMDSEDWVLAEAEE